MSANVIPFRAHQRGYFVTAQQFHALCDARRKLAECWELRVESERVRRGYEERQRAIERLLAGLPSDVERA